MKILIADDEKEVVALIKEFIGDKCETDVAYDGEQALELIKLNKYDLAFLDHNMPEFTGLELIAYIKKNKLEMGVVMITGYQQMAGFAAKGLGADEYLTKPFKLKEIDDIIVKYKTINKKNG
jgi:CheY-like chemotaxis protein